MLDRLRARLIAVTMLSLSLVLLVILGGINLMSYRQTVSDADALLALLADYGGAFPMPPREGGAPDRRDAPERPAAESILRKRGFTDETPYETRFFSVLLGGQGQVLGVDTGRIAAVDEEAAAGYALSVLEAGGKKGFFPATASCAARRGTPRA